MVRPNNSPVTMLLMRFSPYYTDPHAAAGMWLICAWGKLSCAVLF